MQYQSQRGCIVSVVQLRLVALPSQLPGLKVALRHASAKAGRKLSPVTRTYYDSADLKLRQQSLSLFVEQRGTRRGQSLEDFGSVDGVETGEWWDPIATDRPDPAVGKTGPRLRAIVDVAELQPFFETQIRRTFYKVSPNSNTEIAATLREGQLEVATGDTTEAVCELELELTQGDPTAVYDLALRLLDAVPLRIETLGLAERGYRLSDVQSGVVTSPP
jgi:inorganic triphosphatase YgiF